MTQNFEACWDLSGRWLRHVFTEKLLEEWLKRQEEEEAKLKDEIEKYKDQVQPLIESIDASFLKTMKELDEWMIDGVKKGRLE